MSAWISVKDKLPETTYEETNTSNMVSQSVLVTGEDVSGSWGYGFAHYQDDGSWHCYGGEHDFMNVMEISHWMPIPAVPF